MTDNRNNNERLNSGREKQLDRLLDSALAQYGAAEPLHGLEDRVLRRLQEEPAPRAWWMWGGVAAALAAVVVAVMLLSPKAEQKPATSNANVQPGQSAPKQEAPPAVAAKAPPSTTVVPKQPVTAAVIQPRDLQPGNLLPRNVLPRNQGQAPVNMAVLGGLPRHAVFPTPRPPTDQEILLARYMRVTPRDEVLAQINRKPLEFHEDPLSVPVGGSGASPHKAEGTK